MNKKQLRGVIFTLLGVTSQLWGQLTYQFERLKLNSYISFVERMGTLDHRIMQGGIAQIILHIQIRLTKPQDHLHDVHVPFHAGDVESAAL